MKHNMTSRDHTYPALPACSDSSGYGVAVDDLARGCGGGCCSEHLWRDVGLGGGHAELVERVGEKADAATAVGAIVAELRSVACGVQPILKDVVGIGAVVASDASAVLCRGVRTRGQALISLNQSPFSCPRRRCQCRQRHRDRGAWPFRPCARTGRRSNRGKSACCMAIPVTKVVQGRSNVVWCPR